MSKSNDIWVVFDVDGVITDGTIATDGVNGVNKCINLKDIDAIYELVRNGVKIAAITAEKDHFSDWVKNRFPWNDFYDGVSDKGNILSMIRDKHEICSGKLYYIGDGKKDISAFDVADVSLCPADAILNIQIKADIVLKGKAGSGALWELVHIMSKKKQIHASYMRPSEVKKTDVRNIWSEKLKIHRAVLELMEREEVAESICSSASLISVAIRNNHKLILFGNGGSAADAQHIAAEFVGKFNVDREAWNAIALTTNSSIITAVANDFDFDYVFSRQISALVTADDVVVGISTSGSSRNVLEGLKTAKKAGAHTIMLTGENCHDNVADICVNVPATYTPCIQEMHIVIGHFWVDFAEEENS